MLISPKTISEGVAVSIMLHKAREATRPRLRCLDPLALSNDMICGAREGLCIACAMPASLRDRLIDRYAEKAGRVHCRVEFKQTSAAQGCRSNQELGEHSPSLIHDRHSFVAESPKLRLIR